MKPKLRFRVRTLLIITALVCVYLGSYRALMQPKLIADISSDANGGLVMVRAQTEHYVAAPRFCHLAFFPANQLDRWIRSSFWAQEEFGFSAHPIVQQPSQKPYFLLHYPGDDLNSADGLTDTTNQPMHTEPPSPVF